MRRLYVGIVLVALVYVGILVSIGRVPFPGDFMRAWYEPWRTETVVDGVPTVPHKAVGHDIFRQIYPLKALSVDILSQGSIPLWNPYNGSGQPLLAASIQTVFNPVMGVFFVLNPATSWTVLYVGQFAVLAASFVLFMSGLGVSMAATLISCIALLGSSFVVANSLFSTFLYSFAGLPLLLWCVDEIARGKTRGWIILPLSVMWTILTGFPQLTMYIFMTVGSYAIFRLWKVGSWKFWLTWLCSISIGIGLSAIQLIPQFELYRLSAINTSTSEFIFRTFLMPPSHLLSLIVPNFFGNPATYNYWGYADYVETAVSVGSIVLWFAILGVYRHERKQRADILFFVSLGVGACILALRSPFTEWLYRLPIPVLTTGVPTRSLGIGTFALCALAAFGIDAFLGKRNEKRIFVSLGVVWLALAGLLVATYALNRMHVSCNNSIITSCFSIAFRNSIFEIGVFTLCIGIVVVSRIVHGRAGRVVFIGGIVSIVLGASLYNAHKFIPFTDVSAFMPEHVLLKQLQKMSPQRIAYQGVSIPTDLATHYRFYDTNYYAPLYIRRYGELVSYVNTGSSTLGVRRSDVEVVAEATVSADLAARRNRFWDMTGSGILVTKKSDALPVVGNNTLWEDAYWRLSVRPTAFPRVYFVSHLSVETRQDKELEAMFAQETDMTKTAFVDSSVLFVPEKPLTHASATINLYSSNRISIATDTSLDAFLVLSDTYYPGWSAYVDGEKTPVYRTNYAFRGVVVPEGKHVVVFEYAPDSWRYGIWTSVISVGLWIVLVGMMSRKHS